MSSYEDRLNSALSRISPSWVNPTLGYVLGGGAIAKETRAELDAYLLPPDGTKGIVYNDGANSGIYIKVGSASSGEWQMSALLDGRAFFGEAPAPSAGIARRVAIAPDGAMVKAAAGYANIIDHDAAADFDADTGTWGTDNTAAIAAAAATGDAIYAPTGDYYISDATILRTKTVVGPGRFFTTYNGAVRQIGNRVYAGVCRQDVGDDLAGGLVIGEPGQGGFLFGAQNANYGVMQPVDNGMPMQWQLYSRNLIGTATSEAGGDGLTAVYRTFSLSPPWAGGVELVAGRN